MTVTPAERAEEALAAADDAFGRRDLDAMVAHLSAAVRGFTAADDARRAALACARLGDAFSTLMGNFTAGRAWYRRARRLVDDLPPCVEQGWVAVAAMGCDVDDPADLLAAAELALDRARRFGDVNLETKALADAGLAHVQLGRIDVGMAMLDEAMALACGPADDAGTSARSVCSFFTACYVATDFERADNWTGLLRQRGLIGLAPGGPVFLSTHCDRLQAALLMQLGRWGEAEQLLAATHEAFLSLMAGPDWHADLGLAELRVRQGRLTDAEALLLGKEQMIDALLPLARLHVARGDHALARVTAERGLRNAGADRLRAIELLDVLVDVAIATGDLDAARATADELSTRIGSVDVAPLRARAADAQARVLAAGGQFAAAAGTLEAVIDTLDPVRLPWLRARLLVHLARIRESAGDLNSATIDARAAGSLLAPLDVVLDALDRAALDRLGPAPAPSPTAARATLTLAGGSWTATADGVSYRLRDTKGLRYLAALVASPGAERHVLDLVDAVEGADPDRAALRRSLGDAGPLADGQARRAYRQRATELRGEIDDALAADQFDLAEARQRDLDGLLEELSRAFGLGGRDRMAASAAERARLNVTRAVRAALARLIEAMPDAGAALDRRVRTGLYCVYEPDPSDRFRWIVQQ